MEGWAPLGSNKMIRKKVRKKAAVVEKSNRTEYGKGKPLDAFLKRMGNMPMAGFKRAIADASL
jgi:hypothetical protein